MIGYLDREGNFFKCECWEHLDLATRICNERKWVPKSGTKVNRLTGEDILLKEKGWILFSARSVSMNTEFLVSNKQRDYLLDFLDRYGDCWMVPDSKIETIKDLLKRREWRERYGGESL